jgi:hypothetical protein
MHNNSVSYVINELKTNYQKQYVSIFILDNPKWISGYIVKYINNMLIVHDQLSTYYIDIDKISYIALYDGYKNGVEIDES